MQQCRKCWSQQPAGCPNVGCKHTFSKERFFKNFDSWPAYKVASFLKVDVEGPNDPYVLSKSYIYVYGNSPIELSNCPSYWSLAFAKYPIAECRARRLRYATNMASLR